MIERFIALRYLKHGSGFAYVVTLFSFIGIALGVATLIIVTSVMNGFRAELLDKIVGMRGHVVVSNKDHNCGIYDYQNILSKISKIPNVVNIIPQIEQQAILLANGAGRGVIVQGLSKESLASKTLVSSNIKYGNIEDFSNGKIFIGKRLAESSGLKIGDSLKLFLPDGVITPFGKLPKEESFEISGVFEVGMNEYDKNICILPLDSAQSFFNLNFKISQFDIFLSDIDSAAKTGKLIASILGNNFSVLDWKHSDASIFHAVVVEKNVMTLILSIIVLVAMFNIISGLVMLTNSKVRDIAILRTFGASQSSILKIFFYIGSSIGILGTGVGFGLGVLVSVNIDKIKSFLEKFSEDSLFSEEIYFLSQIPSKTDWVEVFIILAMSIFLCFLASVYPAIKASKLDPIEALRM